MTRERKRILRAPRSDRGERCQEFSIAGTLTRCARVERADRQRFVARARRARRGYGCGSEWYRSIGTLRMCRRRPRDAARFVVGPRGRSGGSADREAPGRCRQVEPTVSRVLSRVIIHLDAVSPRRSSDLPGDSADHAIVPLFGLAPGGVYLAVECCHRRGALLPHPFTLTGDTGWRRLGGLLSAALAVGSRPPGITWRPVLRSPDFPRRSRALSRPDPPR